MKEAENSHKEIKQILEFIKSLKISFSAAVFFIKCMAMALNISTWKKNIKAIRKYEGNFALQFVEGEGITSYSKMISE